MKESKDEERLRKTMRKALRGTAYSCLLSRLHIRTGDNKEDQVGGCGRNVTLQGTPNI
jgi:hypothetical protein